VARARRPPAVTDEIWAAIFDAAKPHTPDDQAIYKLDDAIHEFGVAEALSFTSKQLISARKSLRKIAKQADEHARELMNIRYRGLMLWDDDTQDALLSARRVQRLCQEKVAALDDLLRSRKGQHHPGQQRLLDEMFNIWLAHFGGELASSVPRGGGPPGGPLIRFISVVFRIFAEPTAPDTLRTAIREARRKRARRPRHG
jgi:hypothetical protein